MFCLFIRSSPSCRLLDAEDDKLGGLDNRNTDFGHHLSCLAHFWWVYLFVASDKERFIRSLAKERAISPLPQQEVTDAPLDALPQRRTVWLKYHELRSLVYGLAQEIEEAACADVSELTIVIASKRARTPYLDAPIKGADDVYAFGVEP